MTHIATLLFAFAGFTALCMAMTKHQPETLGRRLTLRDQTRLRLGGAAALAAAYACAVVAVGWKFGAVEWVGATMLGALALTLMLPYRPRWTVRAGIGAAGIGAMLCASAALIALS